MTVENLMGYLKDMDPESNVTIVDNTGILCEITAVTERHEKTFTAIGEIDENKSVVIECVEVR